jgi:hypothetical protein
MKIGTVQRDTAPWMPFSERQPDVRYRCPCCGYPTLVGRNHFDICELCKWEDDGQDDPYAAEVWGGPNHRYSLTQARRNFEDHLNQYDTDDPFCDDDNDATREAKRNLMAAFDAIESAPDEKVQAVLWQHALNAEKVLKAERDKRFRDRAWAEERGQRWLAYREKKEPGYLARREKAIAIRQARRARKDDSQGDDVVPGIQ